MRFIKMNNNILGMVTYSEEVLREMAEAREAEAKFRSSSISPSRYERPVYSNEQTESTQVYNSLTRGMPVREKIHGLKQRRHYNNQEEAELHSLTNASNTSAAVQVNKAESPTKKTATFSDDHDNVYPESASQDGTNFQLRRMFEDRGTSPINVQTPVIIDHFPEKKSPRGKNKTKNNPILSQEMPSRSKKMQKSRPRSIPLSKSHELPLPPKEFASEAWTKKLKQKDKSWTTCNREYGTFPSSKKVVRMDGMVREDPDDGGPWMASQYQMGYNVKPEMKEKWLNSWKGYVKRKPDMTEEEMKEIISPNTYKNKAPPMVRGEGWVDNGPWGASTYQMGYNISPRDRDPKPIYRFTKDPDINMSKEEADEEAESKAFNALKTIPKAMKKNRSGVKLPPIPNISDSARKDIQLHNGDIYMAVPEEKKHEGVNEQFFNFKYKSHWKPMPLYKSAR